MRKCIVFSKATGVFPSGITHKTDSLISCDISAIVLTAIYISAFLCVCVVAVSPSANGYNETLSTLRYAAHARNIVNKPRVNEVSGCFVFDAKL